MAKIRLEQIMQKKEITYRQLAYLTGISRNMLLRIAKGQRSPTVDQLEILAKNLQLTINDFFESDYK